MPHLRVRGVTEDVVQKFSHGLNQELAQVMQTSIDNFTVEWVASKFYENGAAVKGYPIIEVHMFEREQSVKDQAARAITERMRSIVSGADIAVVFCPLAKTNYFENGSHF